MAGEVKLKITATDDASKEIEKVNESIETLGETAKEAAGDVEKVGDEVDGLGDEADDALPSIRALMEVDQIKKFKDAATKAFGQVADAIKGMVNEYMDYAEQVNDLSRLTGISAESASRLIQITDDVRISYETMNTAMQAATRQGVDVSVEGLMRLSDQYLAMQPGLERSEWLLQTFGRSGAEMGQLLEIGSAGIKAMNEEVAKGLILNEQNVKDMEEAKLAYDNFNDSIMNVKYQIVSELIPAFNSLPEPLKNVASGLIAFGPQIGGTISTIADLTIAFQGLSVLFKPGGLLAGAGKILLGLKGAAAALGLAAAPVLALAAAIAVLIGLLKSQVGQEAINTLKQLAVIWAKMIYGNAGAQIAMNITGLSGKAAGGSVTGGTPYIVGEKGPEIYVPQFNGSILPNDQTKKLMSAYHGPKSIPWITIGKNGLMMMPGQKSFTGLKPGSMFSPATNNGGLLQGGGMFSPATNQGGFLQNAGFSMLMPAQKSFEGIQPPQPGGGINFIYSPTISMASRSEAEMVIRPMIENIVRSRYGKY